MSPDEVRELFSPSFDGELEGDRRAAFDAALAADPGLRAEYEEFAETLRIVSRMGDDDGAPTPDLVAGVQDRLRKRSRGRYYGDRFSQRQGPGWVLPMLAAMALLLLGAIAYLLIDANVVLEEVGPSARELPAHE